MDAEWLEADSAPPSTGEESAAPDDAQNPQGSALKSHEVSTKTQKRDRHESPANHRRAGQGRADSAPTPAPKIDKAAPRKPRRTWGGKYDALTPKGEA
jgi:hypothetical protein